jgi:hypothetical protein
MVPCGKEGGGVFDDERHAPRDAHASYIVVDKYPSEFIDRIIEVSIFVSTPKTIVPDEGRSGYVRLGSLI